jgi:hypothetical protein
MSQFGVHWVTRAQRSVLRQSARLPEACNSIYLSVREWMRPRPTSRCEWTAAISEYRYRWLRLPAITFVTIRSPSPSNRRDGVVRVNAPVNRARSCPAYSFGTFPDKSRRHFGLVVRCWRPSNPVSTPCPLPWPLLPRPAGPADGRVSQVWDSALAPGGLTNGQLAIIAQIKLRTSVTVAVLANSLRLERTSLTRNLSRLEAL